MTDRIRGSLSTDTRDFILSLLNVRRRSLESDVAWYERRDHLIAQTKSVRADLAKVMRAVNEIENYGSV